MALNNQLNNEWPTNRLRMHDMNSLSTNTSNGSNGNAANGSNVSTIGPKKIIRNLALKRNRESIPLENKVIMSSIHYYYYNPLFS